MPEEPGLSKAQEEPRLWLVAVVEHTPPFEALQATDQRPETSLQEGCSCLPNVGRTW
jgi:hypothetical protein